MHYLLAVNLLELALNLYVSDVGCVGGRSLSAHLVQTPATYKFCSDRSQVKRSFAKIDYHMPD